MRPTVLLVNIHHTFDQSDTPQLISLQNVKLGKYFGFLTSKLPGNQCERPGDSRWGPDKVHRLPNGDEDQHAGVQGIRVRVEDERQNVSNSSVGSSWEKFLWGGATPSSNGCEMRYFTHSFRHTCYFLQILKAWKNSAVCLTIKIF